MQPPSNSPVDTRAGNESGQSLVELVLGLPLLLIVLVAILQFGIVMHDYVEVTQAARAGARKASVSRKTDPRGKGIEAVRQSATGLDEGRMGITVTPTSPARGTPVSVEVSYPFEVDVLGLVIKSGEMSYRATARMQ